MREKMSERVLIRRDAVYFGGMNLSYQLFLCRYGIVNSYQICVQKEGERCEGVLGTDILRALDFYQSIVQGGVTPSALDAVIKKMQLQYA